MEEKIAKIKEIHEKSLWVPEEKPQKQMLLCVVGLIGGGKTTVLEPLSKRLNLVRMSTDEIRKLLKEHGLGYGSAQEINVDLVRKYLNNGYSVAIDGDSVTDRSRKLIEETGEKYVVKIVWIHVNPPEEFIINKLKNYKHTWLFRDAEHAVENYMGRKQLHEKLNLPFVYTFDPSKEDLEKQIEEAASIIERHVRD